VTPFITSPSVVNNNTVIGTIQTSHKIWHDASRSQWQEYALKGCHFTVDVLKIGEILHMFPSGTESMGGRGSKKAYTGPSTSIYLPTKFGCESINRGRL